MYALVISFKIPTLALFLSRRRFYPVVALRPYFVVRSFSFSFASLDALP